MSKVPPESHANEKVQREVEVLRLQSMQLLDEREELQDQLDAIKSREKETQAQRILTLAGDAELFHTPDGKPYVTYRVHGCRHTSSVRSGSFVDWLLWIYYQDQGRPPSSQALQDAKATLAAKARYYGPEITVHLRVAGGAGLVYIDLCNERWQAVEIDTEGWRIVDNPPVKFRRTNGMKALPHPRQGGSLDLLRRHIPAKDDSSFVLLLAYLVQALRPRGPYPVLEIRGEQGSGKSTASRIIRDCIDPSVVQIRTAPRDEHDLVIAADGGWMLAFDNLSAVKPWLSDAFCRISTGGGFGTRKLYTDREEELFTATRPLLLNGIDDLATRPDLADRALVLQLEVIPESERKTEDALWEAFVQDHPLILGALFDAVSTALANIESVKVEGLPRMADFATWAVAAEAAFPTPQGTFLGAYQSNQQEAVETAVEADTVAAAIRVMLEEKAAWEGTTSELTEVLKAFLTNPDRPPRDYPTSPQAMTARLRRIAPVLRAIGINREDLRRTGSKRGFRLEYTGKSMSDTSDASKPAPTALNRAFSHDEVPGKMTSRAGEHQAARHSESSPNGHRNAARDKLDVHDEGLQDRSNGHHVFRAGDRVSTAQGEGTVKQAFVDRVTVHIDGAERAAFFMPHELKAPF